MTAIAEMSAAAREAVPREGAAPGLTLHASVAEMLDAAAVDGVLIVAPTDQHGAIIAEVAARGLPILCEKPCGLTAAAARASAQTAAAAGVPLQVAYWRRFVPALRRLHDPTDRRGRAWRHPPGHLLPVGRAASPGGVPGAQRRDRGRHGRARVRPATLADRPGHQRSGGGGLGPGARRDRRRGRRSGDRHAVRRRMRVHLTRSLLPGGRRGSGPRRSAPWAASAATSSTRPRASAPSSRRCAVRPRASPSSRPACAVCGRHRR